MVDIHIVNVMVSRPNSLPEPRTDVGQLRAFVAVARAGSVGRAATLLGRTQPSVSHRLAALERAWGTRLFRRAARGMTLTPEGGRLLPRAEATLRALEELDREAGLPVSSAGELRLGAGDALGREILPRALARLTHCEPGIEVHLREGPGPGLLEALREGEIDLALVVPDARVAAGEGLDFEPLLRSEVHLLARQGRLGPGDRPVPLRDLGQRPLVVLQPESAFRRGLERAFAGAGVPFRPAVEVGNLSLVRRFVAAGLGVAPVPAIAFRSGERGPGVEQRRLLGVPPVTYHRVMRAGAPVSALTRRLLELLAPE